MTGREILELEQTLKPCPFCGGHDVALRVTGNDFTKMRSGRVSCLKCHSQGQIVGSLRKAARWCADTAARAWNRRADDPPQEVSP